MIAGIGNLTVDQIQQRILSFDHSYVGDWNTWLRFRRDYPLDQAAPEFGRILRRWQACRPNIMRRCRGEAAHEAPYLEDLFLRSIDVSFALTGFDLSSADAVNQDTENVLLELWAILKDLSYTGRCRNGLAGVVGISKAVLLLTEGRVGPAFDSTIRRRLGTGDILTAKKWILSLKTVAEDIAQFERLNQCTLIEAVPSEYSSLYYGRLYDMILGPGTGNKATGSWTESPKKPSIAEAGPKPKCNNERRRIGMLITHGGRKAKRFDWTFSSDYVEIKKENEQQGQGKKYSLAEIFSILHWLTDRFGADWFPLANNVEKLWRDEEADGLGVAILRQQPRKIEHAQGSSYLGVVLEHVGILEWNNRQKRIEWRIIRRPENLDDLRKTLTTRTA